MSSLVCFGLCFCEDKTVEWDWFSISQASKNKKMLYIYTRLQFYAAGKY